MSFSKYSQQDSNTLTTINMKKSRDGRNMYSVISIVFWFFFKHFALPCTTKQSVLWHTHLSYKCDIKKNANNASILKLLKTKFHILHGLSVYSLQHYVTDVCPDNLITQSIVFCPSHSDEDNYCFNHIKSNHKQSLWMILYQFVYVILWSAYVFCTVCIVNLIMHVWGVGMLSLPLWAVP